MIDLEIIGSRIRALRTQSGMTQNELAEILRVSFQAVSNWERGIAPPDLENLMRISAHFGVSADDLLRPSHSEICYLGVDGGGTKTEFTLTNADGHVLKSMIKDGCNPNDIGINNTVSLIRDGVRELLAEYPHIGNAFMGISGISVSDYAAILQNELSRTFPAINSQIKTDIFNLFAIEETVNMAVISGTGSVVFVKKGNEYKRIGGWGYLFDSAGSAYDIGRAAVTLALSEEDTMSPPSLITRMLRERFGTSTVWEHINTLYTRGKPYIAGLSTAVFDAYLKGDTAAERIIDENGKALARLLNTGVSVHGAESVAIANGGLFSHYPEIMTGLISKYSEVKLILSPLPPVYGACKIARTMNAESLPEDFHQNFKNSYRSTEK